MASMLITSEGGITGSVSSKGSSSSSSRRRRRSIRNEQVYVAAVALRATRGPGQLLMSVAYSLRFWDFQHFMVLVKPPPHAADSKVYVYDFQPKDPENIYVALAALSGGAIPGAVSVRKVSKLPRRRCWFVGTSTCENAVGEAAESFNKGWHTDLRIGHHDCRHYTNGLVEQLTGHKQVLQSLRRGAFLELPSTTTT